MKFRAKYKDICESKENADKLIAELDMAGVLDERIDDAFKIDVPNMWFGVEGALEEDDAPTAALKDIPIKTLRDEFAMVVASWGLGEECWPDDFARQVYKIADAMMEARVK